MKKNKKAARPYSKTIAILYHRIDEQQKSTYFSKDYVQVDTDTLKTVKYLRALFLRHKYLVKTITVTPDDLSDLKYIHADYIFNLVDSKAMEMRISRLLDRLDIPHSGSPLPAIRISNNKILTKRLFQKYGIPTPKFTAISLKTRISRALLPSLFPIILKPAYEHCSIGITENSIVTTYKQFVSVLKHQRKVYKQTILAEEFIMGREFHVTVLESGEKTMTLPMAEVYFKRNKKNKWRIYGFDEKWNDDMPLYTFAHFMSPPKNLDPLIETSIKQDAIRAFYMFQLRDYARFDIRYHVKRKQWYFLEGNANAGISPGDTDDAMNSSIHANGMTLNEFIMTIVRNRLPR